MRRLAKPIRKQDPQYLEFIRRQRCLVSGIAVDYMEAHHVRQYGHGGTGTKPDDSRAVPLRAPFHREYHEIGRRNFEAKYQIDLEFEIARLRKEYAALNVKPAKAKKAVLKPRIDCIAIICSCGLRHLPSLKQVSFEQDGMRYWCRKNRNYMVAEL